jgi:hypothetical protein
VVSITSKNSVSLQPTYEEVTKMNLEGKDVVDGLRDWLKAEIKGGPSQGYDLGKFFFTVSIGTVGALATLEKLNASPKMDKTMIISLIILFFSVLVALNLARPRKYEFSGETDLMVEYTSQIDRVLKMVWLWFVLWLAGAIVGAYAVKS